MTITTRCSTCRAKGVYEKGARIPGGVPDYVCPDRETTKSHLPHKIVFTAVVRVSPPGVRSVERKRVSGLTKSGVEVEARELEYRVDKGETVKVSRQRFGEYATGTWLPLIEGNVKVNTHTAYREQLEYVERACADPKVSTVWHTPISDLQPLQLTTLYVWLTKHGATDGSSLSRVTVRHVASRIRQVLDHAWRNDLIRSNPADKADVPKVERRPIQGWDLEQAETFLSAVEGDRLRDLWAFFALTGLRRSEAIELKWEDVHLDGDDERGSYLDVVGKTKTEASRASVSLAPPVVDLLRRWRKRQAEERLARKPETWHDTGLVWTKTTGEGYSNDWISTLFRRTVAGTPLASYKVNGREVQSHLHTLRHSTATILRGLGYSDAVIGEHLRHASSSSITAMYGRVPKSMTREAVDRMGEALGSVASRIHTP